MNNFSSSLNFNTTLLMYEPITKDVVICFWRKCDTYDRK